VASALETINVVTANFTAEVSVLPNVILMVTGIVAASFMADPLIVLSMNVRSFGMAWLVAKGGTPLLATWVASSSLITVLNLS